MSSYLLVDDEDAVECSEEEGEDVKSLNSSFNTIDIVQINSYWISTVLYAKNLPWN